ncbi:hypothetical protein [Burkholderia cepacia]|uniref:hypothetical protein n=1 Tax=Burkholderia cepacia TaxID=292 RepID=UPI00158A2378|nr:hypothetical protein [Burkholderia cepacia]
MNFKYIKHYELTKRLVGYLKTRFIVVSILWISICVGAIGFNLLVQLMSNGAAKLSISYDELRKFADLKLVIAIIVGAAIVGISRGLLAKNLTMNGVREEWGRGFLLRVTDETSSVLTHFASITVIYSAFFDHSDVISYGILALAFWFFAVLTFDAEGNVKNYGKPSAGDYDAQITSPSEGQTCGQSIAVISGSLLALPPTEYTLWLVRKFTADTKEFRPVSAIQLPAPKVFQKERLVEWQAIGCYVGGQIGMSPPDQRFLELWLVGAEGKAVFEAWQAGNQRFEQVMANLSPRPPHLYPGLTCTTSDMIKITEFPRKILIP